VSDKDSSLAKLKICLESWLMQYVQQKYLGVILVIISSICFAFVPNSAKVALDEGTSLSFLLVSRYAIGVALLLPMMFLTKTKLAVPNYLAPEIIKASVLALGLIWATYHAVEFLDVGLVLIILYSFPIGVALISYFKREILINFQQIACMFLLLFGLWTMIYEEGVSVNLYGLVISFAGLICFIFFIVSASKIADTIGSTVLNFYICLIGLSVLLAVILLHSGIAISVPTTLKGILAVASNGFFFILSWVLYFEGAKFIGATRASFLACLEPLFAALLAILLLGQLLSIKEWAGFFVILSSVLIFEILSGAKQDNTTNF
jgi:drug/metabolite transporter (DMT)-like permease